MATVLLHDTNPSRAERIKTALEAANHYVAVWAEPPFATGLTWHGPTVDVVVVNLEKGLLPIGLRPFLFMCKGLPGTPRVFVAGETKISPGQISGLIKELVHISPDAPEYMDRLLRFLRSAAVGA